jgi:hypothetical protein
MRPGIAELRAAVHGIGVHRIKGDASVLTTVVVNDHSHEDKDSMVLYEAALL